MHTLSRGEHIAAYLPPMCHIFTERTTEGKVTFGVLLSSYLFFKKKKRLSIFSAITSKLADPLTAHNLSHQSLFLCSRCFPMSAGPLTKQDGEPSSFKVLHMSLSFPSPLATPTVGIPPWDAVPASRPDGGKKKKHILIDVCVVKPK